MTATPNGSPLGNRQWGKYSLSDTGGGFVSFPIAFTNSVYVIDVTHYNSLNNPVNIYLEVAYFGVSTAYIRSSMDSTQVFIIAIGK